MHRLMHVMNLLTMDAPPTIHLANTFEFPGMKYTGKNNHYANNVHILIPLYSFCLRE